MNDVDWVSAVVKKLHDSIEKGRKRSFAAHHMDEENAQ